jgi:hypothetical protein
VAAQEPAADDKHCIRRTAAGGREARERPRQETVDPGAPRTWHQPAIAGQQ